MSVDFTVGSATLVLSERGSARATQFLQHQYLSGPVSTSRWYQRLPHAHNAALPVREQIRCLSSSHLSNRIYVIQYSLSLKHRLLPRQVPGTSQSHPPTRPRRQQHAQPSPYLDSSSRTLHQLKRHSTRSRRLQTSPSYHQLAGSQHRKQSPCSQAAVHVGRE